MSDQQDIYEPEARRIDALGPITNWSDPASVAAHDARRAAAATNLEGRVAFQCQSCGRVFTLADAVPPHVNGKTNRSCAGSGRQIL